uniref:Glucuronate isomerase n=1 Tax=Rhizochromulina marina TaxID=1034831 RepID=A0A7S2S087_9STRA|mmetsp:Transcript_23351/g.68191  ORF Transcript_23351/g.68191 Transcript_23351/m.68191 type:complete len:463 (+) Transcript_23351:46-1434(+)
MSGLEATSAQLLAKDDVGGVVRRTVETTRVVDVHTHLFPPTHEDLFLHGIDNLLTYHYLVAEFFMTAEGLAPEDFFALSVEAQADRIWQHLFVDRSPVSEATQGVVTVLSKLGLGGMVATRDLGAIREWFRAQPVEEHVEKVFDLAGVEYVVMTNIPFDPKEARHWRERKNAGSRFRSALRVDALFAGDMETVTAALSQAGHELSVTGLTAYLEEWVDLIHPEYLMASTPHDFHLPNGPLDQFIGCSCQVGPSRSLLTPGSFGISSRHATTCKALELTGSGPELLHKVVFPLCESKGLPMALKVGAFRGLNPSLRSGGDGVVVADLSEVAKLVQQYPKVKFLVTVLSRNNQHEAAVMAQKFPNLHLYGCWWYCNNPSIIEEITRMRIEMLGLGFTAQHSDCRVLEHLLYKWPHFREILIPILTTEFEKLVGRGWPLTEEQVVRDVTRVLRGAYEDFMRKHIP